MSVPNLCPINKRNRYEICVCMRRLVERAKGSITCTITVL